MYDCDLATCPREFRSESAAHQHMSAMGHWVAEFPCETCDLAFDTEEEVVDHMTLNWHYERYCVACDRYFSTAGCLRSVRTWKVALRYNSRSYTN